MNYDSPSTAKINAPIVATAMFEGGQAFLKMISRMASEIDETKLAQNEQQMEQRCDRALSNAKRARSNPVPHLLSAVRNWSRKQALVLLREKLAGKSVQKDFYEPFQFALQQEISTMMLDLQLFWEQEDEQRAEAARNQAVEKRKEAEQAYGAAYPYVRGLNEAVLDGERYRQVIFNDGQQAAHMWANKYEESVKAREKQLEEREKLIKVQEKEGHEHQIALRSLTKWDDRNSFANTVVNTGKNTIGCLVVWVLVILGILLAIYLAFPHPHSLL
ncbi:hypothetical protein KTT_49220 [Tengunoibacter tsumagoiensis]|uniref:Uncharacterized protein n=2 Tax=Tengunoibacter tsumagoiensis TaxID=2014871 RepID=A0A402A7F1_9CHLR|nr:hypothetical protein KTT_49220 [Tengunoibacter tsumagoiensis]